MEGVSAGERLESSASTGSRNTGLPTPVEDNSQLETPDISVRTIQAAKALSRLAEFAAEGNVEAMFIIGKTYNKIGFNIPHDAQKAYYWLSSALTRGKLEAMAEIEKLASSIYLSLKGSAPSELTESQLNSLGILTKAADELECEEAQTWLGMCYLNGYAVEVDGKKALDLFSMAARKGNVFAQYSVGWCYEHGVGSCDPSMADVWYRKSASAGNEGAQKRLDLRSSKYSPLARLKMKLPHISRIPAQDDAKFIDILPFSVGEFSWHLYFYPRGEKISSHVSMYLILGNPGSFGSDWLGSSFHISFILVNQRDRALSRKWDKFDEFSATKKNLGIRWHSPISEVFHPDNGFLQDDSLLLEVEIRVQGESEDSAEEDMAKDFICPITAKVMRDPVMVVESGNSYERSAIEAWFATGKESDPLTGLALASTAVAPNMTLRRAIGTLLEDRRNSLQAAPETFLELQQEGSMDPVSLLSIVRSSPAGAELRREMSNLKRLAQNGFVDAQLCLGQLLRTGAACVPADPAACLPWLKQALDNGRSAAKLELERLCEAMFAVVRDRALAGGISAEGSGGFSVLSDLATQCNLPLARYYIGVCCRHAYLAAADEGLAFRCFSVCAKEGFAAVQPHVGLCLENGIGVERGRERARLWYATLADGGQQWARDRLAAMNSTFSAPVAFRAPFEGAARAKLTSEPFSAHGHEWRVGLYPRGRGYNASSLYIQLELAEPHGLPADWSTPLVRFTLTLVNQAHRDSSRQLEYYHRFCGASLEWGFLRHVPVALAHDCGEGFLVHGCFVVEAEVSVEVQ